jgi:caffeoyl-CoA O-methyltransferase
MKVDPGLVNDVLIESYAKEMSSKDSLIIQALIKETEIKSSQAHMISGPLVTRLLQILIKLSQAQQVLDIGTFTGYSALSMAESLPEHGKVYTCDQDLEILKMAKGFFAQSIHGHKIKVIESDALEFLTNTKDKFELIFLDADKHRLKEYYEAALKKLPARGLLVIDDVLWRKEVLEPKTARAKLIDEFNQYITEDTRVMNVLLPIRHGIQVVMKS